MDALTICQDVFCIPGKIPADAAILTSEYLTPEEREYVFDVDRIYYDDLNPLVTKVMVTVEALVNYFATKYQTKDYAPVALFTAKSNYEVTKRTISDKGGLASALCPELLALVMRLAANHIYVELAGASGAPACLVAFSHAEQVFMNEINPQEIQFFRTFRSAFPTDIQARLTPLQGDCFQLLDLCPNLRGRVGVIQCRNFIHFLDDRRQDLFFKLTKELLQAEGRIAVTANSVYIFYANHKKLVEAHPRATSFSMTQCILYSGERRPLGTIFNETALCKETLVDPANHSDICLYSRGSERSNWVKREDAFNSLDEKLRPKIEKAVEDSPHTKNHGRYIVVVTSYTHLYSKQTLTELFVRNGFEVEHTFVTGLLGHLVHGDEIYTKGEQVGIVARLPKT